MSEPSIFDSQTALPDSRISAKQKTLLGFDERYARVNQQLRLLISASELETWNKRYHHGKLALADLVKEQYPFVIFHGDVGTGKTASAECMANRLVADARIEDSILFKLSNRVRGSGMVGEMGALISSAFTEVIKAAGKQRRAILIIDEGDSLAAARSQQHSHHEDKVAVNTLIQHIDDLRQYGGRITVILCTNRLSALDPALQRRAAIVEEFKRPQPEERRSLLSMDLAALSLSQAQINKLVEETNERSGAPAWTYSDIRTRLYPGALALAFPAGPLTFDHLMATVKRLKPSPVLEDR